MIKSLLSGLLLTITAIGSHAQQDTLAVKYAETVTADGIKKHLEILASDLFEGRETGQMGQKRAAKYIADYFAELGIPPCVDQSYFQVYNLNKASSLQSTIQLGFEEFKFIDDFFFWLGFDEKDYFSDQVVFVGYGIDDENYSDYKGLGDISLKGKIVMVLEGEPFDSDGKSLVSGDVKVSKWADDWRLKRELAQEKGADAIFIVKNNYRSYVSRIKYFLENPMLTLDYPKKRGEEVIAAAFISEELGNRILKIGKGKSLDKIKKKMKKKKEPVVMEMDVMANLHVVREAEKLTGENVLAFIEGSDPELKDEVVIITAHYDHIGINRNGEINNGADDDGSGTSTALELAEAFQTAKNDGFGTRRSVLIMTVSGEEKGLLGSEWYSEYPVFDLDKTVADLNIDMIGRVDDQHDDSNYVYLIGSDKLSTELHAISENANNTYTHLALDYTYNEPDDPNRFYYRSDHYNFAKKGIPVIFYFSGVHEDYHKPTDDVEKILFDKTATIGKLVFYTAWELANRNGKIIVDVENEFED